MDYIYGAAVANGNVSLAGGAGVNTLDFSNATAAENINLIA